MNNNNFEYVDLGLPSGTLWATCNVGATKPEEYGLYFAWGETVGYPDANSEKKFTWEDYKWYGGTDSSGKVSTTKYNIKDGKISLDLEDDAAHVNMGGDWRMPTNDEIIELINNTDFTTETINDVNGMKFTSKMDSTKYIFLPASGVYCEGSIYNICTRIWSLSSGDTPNNTNGWYLRFDQLCTGNGVSDRFFGQSVRGVLNKNKQSHE